MHPLVQVYTIPRTSQLAYVGHICNFRQNVTEFLSRLPTLPANMPFVKVRPRSFAGKVSSKAPFKVDVHKLFAAFRWLKANNRWYKDVEWVDAWAKEWENEDVDIGTSREDDFDDGEALAVNRDQFETWMQLARRHRSCEDKGFELGQRLLGLIEQCGNSGHCNDDDNDSDEDCLNEWDAVRRLTSNCLGSPLLKMSGILTRDALASALHYYSAIQIDGANATSAKELQMCLRQLPPGELPDEICMLHTEMVLACEETGKDVPLEHAGAMSSAAVSDDIGLRADVVQGASDAAGKKFGSGGVNDPSRRGHAAHASPSCKGGGRRPQYPRVDAPEVDQSSSQAIREDTPGYIPAAFPKLFPHGVGDFHDSQGGRRSDVRSCNRLLSFDKWGKYLMTWHVCRFARHTRFRYWFLDTSLRAMAPSMQNTFLKTHAAAKDYTLQDLADPQKRKDLVGQMSTSTGRLPGSVGERRKMRQQLEGMVNQIEAETADQKEKGRQGRIPGGFCTLTCPVYKWEQLFDMVLKSYPSGSSDDPNSCEFYCKWKALPLGQERNMAMRQAFYQLSVANPACVQWYCALKLEMALHLLVDVITRQLQSSDVPGLEQSKERVRANLEKKMGVPVAVTDMSFPDLKHFGQVDDYWLSYEWSDGGIIHAHIALWIVGSPRIDKINVPKNPEDNVVEVDVDADDVEIVTQEEAANRMADFWDRLVTEFNVGKAFVGHRNASCRDATNDVNVEPSGRARATDVIDDLYSLCESIGPRKEMGVKAERATTSPECISSRALTHCMLKSGLVDDDENAHCWDELNDILFNCSRLGKCTPDGMILHGDGLSLDALRARARTIFVSALAEWVNMHDLHEPFANGDPAPHQSCACEDKGRVYCNKLYPRKQLRPGQEEVSEDPRRRDLFRLWMARNCRFLNNFVPIIMLAMLSNCDFQATLTKDAVIEYMTKYMTKSGQGSLVKVMEQSFSLCIEKARENNQGSGSAMFRWFNIQSITEVKSQLETMHLIFGVPRWLSSRSFTDMWLRSDMRKIKSPAQICQASSSSDKLALNSEVERYWQRTEWTLPSEEHLLQKHPLSGLPLWRAILECTEDMIPSDEQLKDRRNEVANAWPKFVERLSWWQLKGIFRRDHGSVKYKQRADIVIVHPEARFTKALTPERWREACTYGLMAYCNHGPCCAQSTFSSLASLEAMSSDELEGLMHSFVFMSDKERKIKNMTACPPHLRRNYELGQARRRRAEDRKLSRPQVSAVLPQVRYVYTENDTESWRHKRSGEMDDAELQRARLLWKRANEEEAEDAKTQDTSEQGTEVDVSMIHRRMHSLLKSWKVSSRELHNATLAAGLQVPEQPAALK